MQRHAFSRSAFPLWSSLVELMHFFWPQIRHKGLVGILSVLISCLSTPTFKASTGPPPSSIITFSTYLERCENETPFIIFKYNHFCVITFIIFDLFDTIMIRFTSQGRSKPNIPTPRKRRVQSVYSIIRDWFLCFYILFNWRRWILFQFQDLTILDQSL